jgi:hypothetical protein
MVHGFEQRLARPRPYGPCRGRGKGKRVQLLNESGDPF